MDNVRKNEITGILLFALSLFLFLCIFTYSQEDLSFYTSSPNSSKQNMTGIVGAHIAMALLFMAGRASYILPLLLLVWGISYFAQAKTRRLFFKLFGAIVLTASVSAILSASAGASRTIAFSNGGLFGSLISAFLIKYLGEAGSMVFIISMIILSVLVATEFLIFPVLMSAFKFLTKFLPDLIGRLLAWIQEKAKLLKTGSAVTRSVRADVSRKLENMKRQVEEVKRTSFARVRDAKKKEKQRKALPSAEKKPLEPCPAPSGAETLYKLPGFDLLRTSPKENLKEREEDLKRKASLLEGTLQEFGVEAKVVRINRGPVITLYELQLSVGTKVQRITSLSDNISLAMKSANIRIVAPLAGKGTIGVEIPNEKSEFVFLRDVLETAEYAEEESLLKLALGKDIAGIPIVADLAEMPHLLVAGATGSGKTVCLNSIISSLLFNASPAEIKFLMIDPKRVELMIFEGIPHLVSPIVTNSKKAAGALNWVVEEMERRYEIFAEKGTRNIASYKEKRSEDEEDLPYIIVVVDELADLMIVAQQDVENAIMRLAQLSRAAGIHIILATQRPSVNVVTGVIKANFPARISFKVASKVDSRTVLDANGAEKLLGKGDMLLMEPGATALLRGQASLVDDSEIKRIVKFIKSQADPQYVDEVTKTQEAGFSYSESEKDDLYHEAVKMITQTRQASVSMIQRKFRVGYTRAARMMDIMEQEGIVGPYNGPKPREILVDVPGSDLEEENG